MTDQEVITELKKYLTLEQIATRIDRAYATVHKVYKGHRHMSKGDRFLVESILKEFNTRSITI